MTRPALNRPDRTCHRTLLLALAITALAACSPGDHGPGQTLSGRVVDLAGAPAAGVPVRGEAGGPEAVTDAEGRFALSVGTEDALDLRADAPDGAQARTLARPGEETLAILLPAETIAAAQALLSRRAEACSAVDGRAYGHAFFDQLPTLAATDWLKAANADRSSRALRDRMEALIMAAREDCQLSEDNWSADITALNAAFGVQD